MAPHSEWHVLVRQKGSEVERLFQCPRCGQWLEITEAQMEGRERIWCPDVLCHWNDMADLTAYRE